MFNDARFWEDEKDSPLLARNHGFVTQQNAPLRCARAQTWVTLLGAAAVDIRTGDSVTEEKFLRILARDAERTFIPKDDPEVQVRTLARQKEHMHNLKVAIAESNDYHQGLGYIAAFLALLLPSEQVCSILLHLHRSAEHSQGYFRSEPEAFVADARVFAKLMAKYAPGAAANIVKWGAVPEMYAVKWFVGLGVHLLPFEHLFNYFELYFRFGSEIAFKFGLAHCMRFAAQLEKATSTSSLMVYLRAEDPHSEWNLPAEIAVADFELILSDALRLDLSADGWQAMRRVEGEKVRIECENARARLAQLAAEDSDDEIKFSDEED